MLTIYDEDFLELIGVKANIPHDLRIWYSAFIRQKRNKKIWNDSTAISLYVSVKSINQLRVEQGAFQKDGTANAAVAILYYSHSSLQPT